MTILERCRAFLEAPREGSAGPLTAEQLAEFVAVLASTIDVMESNALVQGKLLASMGRCVTMAMGCLDPHADNPDEALAWHRLLDAIEGREPRASLLSSQDGVRK